MSRYAEKTSVSSEKSRMEIEQTLQRYGADRFMYGWDGDRAMIQFHMNERRIMFVLEMPDKEQFRRTPNTRHVRGTEATLKAWEQACRQRWRALSLVIKAKLEAVESGITEFEDEFLAHTLLPDGQTVSQFMRPQMAQVYSQNKMPPMLPYLENES